ncbi:MAG TPA: LytTR family DNA-binding domain-containing protein [Leadbetterella sp.]|nr:LytTR family DNA-binding domain-containing protein [Leadbetterella sp.]
MVHSLGEGGFLYLFLAIFQPFEISEWHDPNKYFKLLGFAFVTATATFTHRQFIPRLFPSFHAEKNWVVWKELFSVLLLILIITIGNVFFGAAIFKWQFGFRTFLIFFGWVLGVAIFPIIFWVLSDYIYQLKKFSQPIEIRHKKDKTISETLKLIAENGKDFLELKKHELLYIESSDNYSTIYYRKDGIATKVLIRSSLTRLESQISDTDIVRMHRSYVANLSRVIKISGNAQGFKLHFENPESIIPVARKYSQIIERWR